MRWNAMRFAIAATAATLGLAVPGTAFADLDLGGATLTGTAELGDRIVTGDFGGSAKWDEYRDLNPSAFGNLDFMIEDDERDDYLRGLFTKIGEDDQRYELEGGRWGLGKLRLFYGELPVPLSYRARSPYMGIHEDLKLPSGFQNRVGMFSGALRSQVLNKELVPTRGIDVGYELKKGTADLSFMVGPNIELAAGYRIWDRRGNKPLGIGFGSPGGNFATVAAPVNERIQEGTAALRFGRDDWAFELEYIGSWFDNEYDALRIDNPLTPVDTGSAATTGQMSTAPDNQAHNFQLAGSMELPVPIPARLAVTGGYGFRRQDEDFLPHTINSVVRANPMASLLDLPQDDLDGEVNTWLGNVLLTTEPFENVDFDAHYRYYRYANKTDTITFPAHVVNDEGFTVDTMIADPNSYTRQNADATVGVQVLDPVHVELGYEYERWDRDESRNVRTTNEHGGHMAVDIVATSSLRLNARYALSIRRKGSDYDPTAALTNARPPSELTPDDYINFNLPALRKYTQSDRDRQEASLIGTWLPCDTVDLTLSFNWVQDDYNNARYGLTSFEGYSAGIDVGWQPMERLRMFAGYTYDVSDYTQNARWRTRNFSTPQILVDDFKNDWSSESRDRQHFANIGATIGLIPDTLELELGYLLSYSEAETRSDAVVGYRAIGTSTVDGGNAPDWPDVRDVLQSFQAVARYRVDEHWTLKGGWRWERWYSSNFKLDDLDPFEAKSNINGSGVVSPSSDIFLANRIGDYDAHLFMFSVEYAF